MFNSSLCQHTKVQTPTSFSPFQPLRKALISFSTTFPTFSIYLNTPMPCSFSSSKRPLSHRWHFHCFSHIPSALGSHQLNGALSLLRTLHHCQLIWLLVFKLTIYLRAWKILSGAQRIPQHLKHSIPCFCNIQSIQVSCANQHHPPQAERHHCSEYISLYKNQKHLCGSHNPKQWNNYYISYQNNSPFEN